VANWSLWGGVKILLRTVPHVLGRRRLEMFVEALYRHMHRQAAAKQDTHQASLDSCPSAPTP